MLSTCFGLIDISMSIGGLFFVMINCLAWTTLLSQKEFDDLQLIKTGNCGDDGVRALELNTPLRSFVRTLVFNKDQDASWIQVKGRDYAGSTQSS
jgi:hypothetical protein